MQHKNIFQHYINCVTHDILRFRGRGRRMEFWSFMLCTLIVVLTLGAASEYVNDDIFSALLGIFILLSLIPMLAAMSRRLHDIGKSGTWAFIYFVPVVGGIWLPILLLSDSVEGRNRYGNDPKNPTLGDEIEEIGTE